MKIFQLEKNDVKPRIPRRELTTSVGYIVTPKRSETYLLPDNPDDVYQRRCDLSDYYKMLTDPQIKAASNLKKNLIMGRGWEIEPPVDNDGKPIKGSDLTTDFIHKNFEDLFSGPIDELFFNILSAIDFGYSVNELIFAMKDQKLYLKEAKQLPPDSIRFPIDEKGEFRVDGIIQYTPRGEELIPQEKIIIYAWDKRDDNPYGNSDLRAARNSWFSKLQILKFWNMSLERFGMPFLLGRYNPSLDQQGRIELQNIVNSVQAATSAVIPEDVELEFKEITQRGAVAFQNAIDKHNEEILRALGIPDLMGFGSTKGGSLALGQMQAEILATTIQRYIRGLEDTINEQVIRRLIDLNFNGITQYPKIKFKSVLERDETEKARTYVQALNTATFIPTPEAINKLHEILGFPTTGDVQIAQPQDTTAEPAKKTAASFASKEDIPIFADKEIDFKAIDDFIETRVKKTAAKIERLIKDARNTLVSDSVNKKVLEVNNFRYIATLKIENAPQIRTQFEKLFMAASLQGTKDAKEEIKKQVPKSMAIELPEITPLAYKKAYELQFGLINNPDMSITDSKEFLAKLAKTKAFQVADDISTTLRKNTRIILLQGMDEGKATKEVIADLEQVFAPYVEGNVIPSASTKPYRLETIVRTNMTNFYNLSRTATYIQAGKEGLVTHMEYSAVLDNRTSSICTELHGTVIPVSDTQTISTIKPSRHFNCRSILVPITTYRVDDMQEKLDKGELKEGLRKPLSFYDGFKPKSQKI